MYNTIAKCLETKGIVHDCEFGFRTNHSTQHAIITLVDKIAKSVDSGDVVINLFVDLRKAFDTASHTASHSIEIAHVQKDGSTHSDVNTIIPKYT